MTVLRVEVAPNVLEWARQRSGIPTDAWPRALAGYSGWVAGEARPTFKQLQHFAAATHTPLGFLLLPQPPVEAMPLPDFRTVADRGAPAASVNLLDMVYTCEARQDWYRNYQLTNGEEPLAFVGSFTLDQPVAEAADTLRALLQWNADARRAAGNTAGAVAALREAAEVVGVLVMISGIVGANTHRVLDPDEFRGFALSDPLAPLVFVNGADTKAAQVFTIVHELAHLLLGSSAISDTEPQSVNTFPVERWCNAVAAEVLMPADEFAVQLGRPRPTIEELEGLATRFRVSTLAVLRRMRDTGRLDGELFWTAYRAEQARIAALMGQRAKSSGGNFYNSRPVQLSKRFARAVISSTLEGGTLYSDAFRLLGTKKQSTFDSLGVSLGVA